MMRYIKYFIYTLSRFFPRSKSKWVFGSFSCFAENPKYLLIYMTEHSVDIKGRKGRYIWISKSDEELLLARHAGIESYKRYSVRGFYHCLTAGVYIYSSYVSDVNVWACGGATKINLWHGVGIKYIEKKITRGASAKMYNEKKWYKKIKYLPIHLGHDGILATSPMMKRHFAECFGVDEDVIIEGIYPRCSIFRYSKNELYRFAKRYEPVETANIINEIRKFTMVYIYMPTWRDSNKGFNEATMIDLDKMNEALIESKSLMIVKLHPNSRLITQEHGFSNMLFVNPKTDIYPILPFTDCLITDYSSIYYDYILMPDKKVILYIPDIHSYTSEDRGLAFDYNECTKGQKVYDFKALNDIIRNSGATATDQSDIISMFWGNANHTMADLCNRIAGKANA